MKVRLWRGIEPCEEIELPGNWGEIHMRRCGFGPITAEGFCQELEHIEVFTEEPDGRYVNREPVPAWLIHIEGPPATESSAPPSAPQGGFSGGPWIDTGHRPPPLPISDVGARQFLINSAITFVGLWTHDKQPDAQLVAAAERELSRLEADARDPYVLASRLMLLQRF